MSNTNEYYPPRRIEQYGTLSSGFLTPGPYASQWNGNNLTTSTASQTDGRTKLTLNRYYWTLETQNPKTAVSSETVKNNSFTGSPLLVFAIRRNDHIFVTQQQQSGATSLGLCRWYNFDAPTVDNIVAIDVPKVYHSSATTSNSTQYYYAARSNSITQHNTYIFSINGGTAWPNTPLPHVNRYGIDLSDQSVNPQSFPSAYFNLYTDGYLDPIGDKGGLSIDKSLGTYCPTTNSGDDGYLYVVPYRGTNPNTFVNGVHALALDVNCNFYRNIYFLDSSGNLLTNGMVALESHIITSDQRYWCHTTTGGVNPSYYNLYELVSDDGTNRYYQYVDRLTRYPSNLRGQAFSFGNNSFVTYDGLISLDKIIQTYDFNTYDDTDTIFTYLIGEDKLIPHTLYVDPDVTDYHCIDALLGLNLQSYSLTPTERYKDIVFTIGFHNGAVDNTTPVQYDFHHNLFREYRQVNTSTTIVDLRMVQSENPDVGIRINTITSSDDKKSVVIDGRYVNDHAIYEYHFNLGGECVNKEIVRTNDPKSVERGRDLYYLEKQPLPTKFQLEIDYTKTSSANCVWTETITVEQPFITTGQEQQELIRNYLYGEPFTQIEVPVFANTQQTINSNTISNPCGCGH